MIEKSASMPAKPDEVEQEFAETLRNAAWIFEKKKMAASRVRLSRVKQSHASSTSEVAEPNSPVPSCKLQPHSKLLRQAASQRFYGKWSEPVRPSL
jgi:hypothetical protein